MSNFKEDIAFDLGSVFFNNNEFAEIVTINGVPDALVVIEKDIDVKTKYEYYKVDVMLHISESFFTVETMPVVEEIIEINGEKYQVTKVSENDGLLSIELERGN